jgi:hypothetical protein
MVGSTLGDAGMLGVIEKERDTDTDVRLLGDALTVMVIEGDTDVVTDVVTDMVGAMVEVTEGVGEVCVRPNTVQLGAILCEKFWPWVAPRTSKAPFVLIMNGCAALPEVVATSAEMLRVELTAKTMP